MPPSREDPEAPEEARGYTQVEREEREEGRSRRAPSGGTIYEAITQEGELELSRPTVALAYSGLAAGLSMGFSFLTQGMLAAGLPRTDSAELFAKLGYSVGFLVVILGRQQLFTENTLTPILPLLKHMRLRTLLHVGRLWATVLTTNLLGALVFAEVIAATHVLEPDVEGRLGEIARAIIANGPWMVLLRGVFAGWLIALVVWLLPFAEAGRIWVIIIVTYVISLGGFSHVVAGSVDVLYLVASGELSLGAFFTRFLLPALAGNVLGGVTLVSALSHGQIAADRRLRRQET